MKTELIYKGNATYYTYGADAIRTARRLSKRYNVTVTVNLLGPSNAILETLIFKPLK